MSVENGTSYKRVDIQVFSTSVLPRSLIAYPPSTRGKKQKFVIGTADGVARVFSVKNSLQLSTVFEVPSTAEGEVERVQKMSVDALCLCGTQLFVVDGPRVCGYTRKGKLFFVVDTNTAAKITAIAVDMPWIFAANEFILNIFCEEEEKAMYVCPDRINLLLLIPSSYTGCEPRCVLACQDRCIRIVSVSGTLLYEILIDAKASAGVLAGTAEAFAVVFGTSAGTILVMDPSRSDRDKPSITCSLASHSHQSGISLCAVICWEKGEGSGQRRLLALARESGEVEIVELREPCSEALVMCGITVVRLWSCSIAEPLIGLVVCSLVSSDTCEAKDGADFLVCTRSGVLIAFFKDATGTATLGPVMQLGGAVEEKEQQKRLDEKINATEGEICELEEKLQRRREELKKKCAEMIKRQVGRVEGTDAAIVSTEIDVECRLELVSADSRGVLELLVDSRAPLDIVAAHSDLESSVFVAPSCAPMGNVSHAELFTLSCNGNTCVRRLPTGSEGNWASTVRFALLVLESAVSGMVRVFIVPKTDPRQCLLRTVHVYPLCLHERISEMNLIQNVVFSMLRITGTFTVQELYAALRVILPGLSETGLSAFTGSSNKQQGAARENSLLFRNCTTKEFLCIKFGDGWGSFGCESPTVLKFIKTRLGLEFSKLRKPVELIVELSREAISAHVAQYYVRHRNWKEVVSKEGVQAAVRDLKTQINEEFEESFESTFKTFIEPCDIDEASNDSMHKDLLTTVELQNLMCDCYVAVVELSGYLAPEDSLEKLRRMLQQDSYDAALNLMLKSCSFSLS